MDLGSVYVSSTTLQRELGLAQPTAKRLMEEALSVGDSMTIEGKKLAKRSAVAAVLMNRNSKVLSFISAYGPKVEAQENVSE